MHDRARPRSDSTLDHRPGPFQTADLYNSSDSLVSSPVLGSYPPSNTTNYDSGESLVPKGDRTAGAVHVYSTTGPNSPRQTPQRDSQDRMLYDKQRGSSQDTILYGKQRGSNSQDSMQYDKQHNGAYAASVSRTRQGLTFIGLFFTIFLSGLDQTVTSTILTHIADDFKALDRIEWVPTIFMLCSTCLNIISGRIADIFGRFSVLMFSLLAFVAGAIASASAQNIVVFIVARGLSGIACGGMLNLSIIVISDIVPMERRGKYLGFLQICFGASNAAGPLVGGLFAERVGWRAAFFADMVMGLVTAVYLAIVLRLPRLPSATPWRDGIKNLDYAGIAVVVTCISLIIVGLNVGGTILLWSSPVTIGCLAIGCTLLCVFVGVELKLARVPLVPMWLFTVRNLVIAFLVTFLCGMAMFSIVFYMPVYFSAVFGANAMQAGLLVLPFGMALSISSFVSGYFMSTPGMYRQLLRFGPATMAIGILTMAICSGKTSEIIQAALLVVPGIGMGNVIVSNVIAAQASTDDRFIATVTPLCEFFLSIGGVIGVAVFGAVHRNKLAGFLTAAAAGEPLAVQVIIEEARRDVSVAYAPHVADSVRMKIAHAYASSMAQALWVILPFLVAALVLSLALEKSPKLARPDEIPLVEQIDDL
ncbi:hypothetical protein GGF46_003048 [Coemansia sp. RSA 552]|nr:hypothetical protein GGF46_003048 [Coemansia sp. RSA 552]